MRKRLLPLLGALGLSIFSPPSFSAAWADSTDSTARDGIRLIVGEGPTTDYHSRITAVRELGLQLQSPEVERLIQFLHKKTDDDPISLAELNAVKNDLVVLLLRQERPPQKLTRHLQDDFRDSLMDPIWRDYCLQHFVMSHRVAETDEDRKQILLTLWEAAAMAESTFAGTALLALRQIASHAPESLDRNALISQAFAVARDPDMPTPSRISAIQVGGPHPGALPIARVLAQDSAADMMLRMSAIAVLGTSSGPEDVSLLETFSSSPDVRLRHSARAALESCDRSIGDN